MFKVIFALSMSSLLLISMANAQPRGGMMMAADDLGLTDDQVDKLADMRFEHQKEMIKKKAALKEARLELRQLMRNAEVDKKAALSRQEKISALKADVARMRLDHRLEMRKVLSNEQLDRWLKMCRKQGPREGMGHKGKRGHRDFGPHGGKGPGKGMGPGPDHDFWD
jgi:Spy/CpxP family protein refolding chaperone